MGGLAELDDDMLARLEEGVRNSVEEIPHLSVVDSRVEGEGTALRMLLRAEGRSGSAWLSARVFDDAGGVRVGLSARLRNFDVGPTLYEEEVEGTSLGRVMASVRAAIRGQVLLAMNPAPRGHGFLRFFGPLIAAWLFVPSNA